MTKRKDIRLQRLSISKKAVVKGQDLAPAAEELKSLESLTASAAELNRLGGVTAGTAAASKAVVLGANKNLDTLSIADGGLKLGSGAGTAVTKTAAQINLLIAALAAGKKLAFGTATIDAASKDIVTGLSTVEYAVVAMVGDPSLTHMDSSVTVGNQTDAPVAGSIRIKSWKPTSSSNVTPIAASSPFGNVAWFAVGT